MNAETVENVKVAPLVVDLDSLDSSTVAESVAIDANANPFEGPPPPPDGTHRFKLKIDKEKWTRAETKPDRSGNKNVYLANQNILQCVAEGESYNNMFTYDFISTLIFDGKSRMATIARLVGAEVPTEIKYPDLAKLYAAAVVGEPIVKVRGRWKAQEKDPSDPSGKKYVTVCAGMKNFPPMKDADGKIIPGRYNHVVQGPKTGELCQAKFEVLEYYAD